MRICVTGGAGFIGASLVRELSDRVDVRVVVLDDLSTGTLERLDGLDVDVRVGSILDVDAVTEALCDAQTVIHLAAVPSVPRSLADPLRTHQVNANGTLVVLEAARRGGAHVLTASSSSVYGPTPTLPASEDAMCRPASPYAVSKLAAESYTLAYRTCFAIPAIAFRFFNVFGPLQAPDHAYAAVIPRFVAAALRGEPLIVHGDGEQSRDFTFVDSVVQVLAEAAITRTDHSTPVNLAFGTRSTLNQVIALLGALLGRHLEVEYHEPRAGDVRQSQASPVTMEALFGHVNPVDLETGLARTVSWMESWMYAQMHASVAK